MADETKKDSPEQDKPLEKMTVSELREIAREIPDVTGVHSMKKDELLALVSEKQGGAPVAKKAAVKKTASPKGPKKIMSPQEIKQAIIALREKKQAAASRRESTILRRRMNRLKKQSRRKTAVSPPA